MSARQSRAKRRCGTESQGTRPSDERAWSSAMPCGSGPGPGGARGCEPAPLPLAGGWFEPAGVTAGQCDACRRRALEPAVRGDCGSHAAFKLLGMRTLSSALEILPSDTVLEVTGRRDTGCSPKALTAQLEGHVHPEHVPHTHSTHTTPTCIPHTYVCRAARVCTCHMHQTRVRAGTPHTRLQHTHMPATHRP